MYHLNQSISVLVFQLGWVLGTFIQVQSVRDLDKLRLAKPKSISLVDWTLL